MRQLEHLEVVNIGAAGQLGTLDRIFGVPATTRNWNTVAAIARVLEHGAGKAAGA